MSTMATTTVSTAPAFTAFLSSSRLRLPAMVGPALHAAAARTIARCRRTLHPGLLVMRRRVGNRRFLALYRLLAGDNRMGRRQMARSGGLGRSRLCGGKNHHD